MTMDTAEIPPDPELVEIIERDVARERVPDRYDPAAIFLNSGHTLYVGGPRHQQFTEQAGSLPAP